MNMTRKKVFFRLALLLYLLALCYVCFAPGDDIPKLPPSLAGIPVDKLVHFLLFVPFAPLVHFGLGLSPILSALLALACALGTEVVQLFLPDRAFELYDFFADSLGICLTFIVLVLKKR